MPSSPAARWDAAQRALAARLDTPGEVQAWLRGLRYNWEPDGETQRGFGGVVRAGEAHCLEAAMAAAALLEPQGYPPLLLDLESADGLDHVLFLYRERGRFGTVGKSREPGLEGRKPVYRNLHTLVQSYAAPYIDGDACVVGYGMLDLRDLSRRDWRWTARNVWYVERALVAMEHRPFEVPAAYERKWARRYRAFRRAHPGREPEFYPNRHLWA